MVKGIGALVSTVSKCRLPCASSAGLALSHSDPPDQFVTAARDFHQRCNIRQSCGRLMRAMNKPILSRAYLLSLPERGFRAGAAVAFQGQGNCILIPEDFEEIVLTPASLQAFGFDPTPGRRLLRQ